MVFCWLTLCVCVELEGKDVEEVFTAVLSPSSNNQPEQSQPPHTAAGSKTHTHHTGTHAHNCLHGHIPLESRDYFLQFFKMYVSHYSRCSTTRRDRVF